MSRQVAQGYNSLQEAHDAFNQAVSEGRVETLTIPASQRRTHNRRNRAPPATSSSQPPGTSRTPQQPSTGLAIHAQAGSSTSVPANVEPVPWYLQKVQNIHRRRRWIMIFKGADIGVFNSWAEAADMVLGMKGAVYNGFYTLEQAERAFEDALEDGFVDVLLINNSEA
jgi:hypothetical protein